MKNRNPEQAKQHREYMKQYFRQNEDKRKKNSEKTNKRGLEKIPCPNCEKHITRVNMKRHIKTIHGKNTTTTTTTKHTDCENKDKKVSETKTTTTETKHVTPPPPSRSSPLPSGDLIYR